MKFPYSLLRDFVDTTLTAEAVGDLLTMAGFELEGIDEVEGEPVLDIKVMSNRGDGLSVFGLAREVLAKDSASHATELYKGAVDRFSAATTGPEVPRSSVSIETTDCSRYACLVLTNMTRKESEPWMQARLRQAGMRPISLLVDVTNYVMLEVGQPLHAFDFDKLTEGRIVVRKAREGEKLTTLNGIEHELRSDQMMICDAEVPVAAAGIMGGLDTEVSDSTTTVLLESAHFLNTSVRRTRKQLGLNTEASYRFERSVDPEGVVAALYRYVQLVQAADPGVKATSVVDRYPIKPTTTAIELRVDRASRLLGMAITVDQAENYLARLGFKPEKTGDNAFRVQSPTWRPDIVREEDLIEELGRVHGYDKIPETMIQGTTTMGGPQGFQLRNDPRRRVLIDVIDYLTYVSGIGVHNIVSHDSRRGSIEGNSPDVPRVVKDVEERRTSTVRGHLGYPGGVHSRYRGERPHHRCRGPVDRGGPDLDKACHVGRGIDKGVRPSGKVARPDSRCGAVVDR